MTAITSYPYVYTGPDTAWGLKKNTRCRITGKRQHAKLIRTSDGREFIVAKERLKKVKT